LRLGESMCAGSFGWMSVRDSGRCSEEPLTLDDQDFLFWCWADFLVW